MSGPMRAAAPRATDLARDLLAELFDALWIEDVAGFQSRAILGTAAEDGTRDYALAIGAGHLRARVRPDGWRDGFRFAGSARYETASSGADIDASALLALVLAAMPDLPGTIRQRSLDELTAIIDALPDRAAWAEGLEAEARADDAIAWERLAAWRDRPFHPLARSRHGFDQAQALAYGAEAGRYFALAWVALARERVDGAPGVCPSDPSATLLDQRQQALLATEMRKRGIDGSHVTLPVHPWQAAHSLPAHFAAEREDGQLVLLDFQGPLVAATSSLRTVALPARPGLHLKLPLDVRTLGVRRLLPPQSLQNGLHGAAPPGWHTILGSPSTSPSRMRTPSGISAKRTVTFTPSALPCSAAPCGGCRKAAARSSPSRPWRSRRAGACFRSFGCSPARRRI